MYFELNMTCILILDDALLKTVEFIQLEQHSEGKFYLSNIMYAVCSFICGIVSASRQRSDLLRFSCQAATYFLSNHSISHLPKDKTNELADLISTLYPFNVVIKQESCYYQFLKSMV